jgi:hypothetical protein
MSARQRREVGRVIFPVFITKYFSIYVIMFGNWRVKENGTGYFYEAEFGSWNMGGGIGTLKASS